MESGKSSLRYTLNSHGYCGDCITRSRAPVRITRSLLGCDRHARCDAVNPWCDSVDFDRTHCCYRPGRSGWSAPGKLFHRKSFAFRSGSLCAGTRVRRISHGEKCLSVCERHARHYPSGRSIKSNPLEKAPSRRAVVTGVSPAILGFCSRHGCLYRLSPVVHVVWSRQPIRTTR